MNNEPVAWKAYEEVNFSDQYILRWVREGDEYVNCISKEMMEDFKKQLDKQADRISELEKDLAKYDELAIDDLKGKGVAWCDCGDSITPNSGAVCGNCATTHPAKTLTDEEIALAWDEFSALQSPKDIKDFARAILRKAQEK